MGEEPQGLREGDGSQAKGKKASLWPDRARREGQPMAGCGRLILGQDAAQRGCKARASEETTCDRWQDRKLVTYRSRQNKTMAVMGARFLTFREGSYKYGKAEN